MQLVEFKEMHCIVELETLGPNDISHVYQHSYTMSCVDRIHETRGFCFNSCILTDGYRASSGKDRDS